MPGALGQLARDMVEMSFESQGTLHQGCHSRMSADGVGVRVGVLCVLH